MTQLILESPEDVVDFLHKLQAPHAKDCDYIVKQSNCNCYLHELNVAMNIALKVIEDGNVSKF